MLGMMVIGAAAGMISIPVLPEMLEAIELRKDLRYNEEELENFISGNLRREINQMNRELFKEHDSLGGRQILWM